MAQQLTPQDHSSSSQTRQRHYRFNDDSAVYEEIEGETLLLHVPGQRYFSLAGSGGEVLHLLLAGHSLESIVSKVSVTFELPREETVELLRNFVGQLVAEQLLLEDLELHSPPAMPLELEIETFTAPELVRYNSRWQQYRGRYRFYSQGVLFQIIDGEALILHTNKGTYYSSAGVGAELLRHLAADHYLEAICEALAEHFNVPLESIAGAAETFVNKLLEEGVIVANDARQVSGDAIEITLTGTYSPPLLEKHSDLEDLLKLDPIHDVDTQGWPKPA